jgi:copper chaperone
MPTMTITIDGMSCGHCLRAVRGALEALEGVTVQEVTMGAARVEAEAESQTGPITAAIEDAGYHVAGVTT